MLRLWRDVRPLRTAESLEAEMGSLAPRLYERKTFEAPYPALDEVREALSREADEKVRPLAFWRAWQLRDEYVKGHVRERYATLVASWEREREAFDAREARIAGCCGRKKLRAQARAHSKGARGGCGCYRGGRREAFFGVRHPSSIYSEVRL